MEGMAQLARDSGVAHFRMNAQQEEVQEVVQSFGLASVHINARGNIIAQGTIGEDSANTIGDIHLVIGTPVGKMGNSLGR